MAEERLILVDESNRATGVGTKTHIHRAGLLHRAFSIFIVDDKGRILLQRRSREKYHSGGLWANSCCGHPRPGERTQTAARRRLTEELGISAPLTFGFFSRYGAELGGGMQENEYVYVYFGPLTAQPNPDPAEVSDVEFASADDIARRIASKPERYVYWLRHYFKNHGSEIARLAKRTARETCPIAASISGQREAPAARR
jgi:isopentenyl-diphosphate delta-isomerase